jgi:16S rRNA (adenine1518-N6/adenine1519-N6)-dimethyltransferase
MHNKSNKIQGHAPNKSFGQNFLQDNNIINAIVDGFSSTIIHNTQNESNNNCVVEIGPGLGALTDKLLSKFKHINVIELDNKLAAILAKKISSDSITIHQCDVLKFDFNLLVNNSHNNKINIIGNLPYNISSPLLLSLIQYIGIVQQQYFMLQKEVVDRMVAAPKSKDYGRLSIILQAHYKMYNVLHVPPACFFPPPKVNSAVVYMTPDLRITQIEKLDLEYITRICFSQRRKMMRGFVEHKDLFMQYGFDLSRRAEEVSVDEYIQLAKWWVINKNY